MPSPFGHAQVQGFAKRWLGSRYSVGAARPRSASRPKETAGLLPDAGTDTAESVEIVDAANKISAGLYGLRAGSERVPFAE